MWYKGERGCGGGKTAPAAEDTFDYSVSLGPSTVPDQHVTTSGGTGYVEVTVTAGDYRVTEGALPAGWISNDSDMYEDVTVPINGTGTATFNNKAMGKIIVDKVTKPVNDPQLFDFALSGDATASFSLTDAAAPWDSGYLMPGNYTVTETVPAGWTLTGISGADSTSGTTAIISLQAGETVNITFEDTKALQTRTQGFWATHLSLSDAVWFSGTVGGHTYTGVADKLIGTHLIGNDGKLMGAFWSNIASISTAKGNAGKRSNLDQARMQLLQQLVAAILNNAAFGSSPSGSISIANAKWAFQYGTLAQVRAAMSAMAAFNQSGDTLAFTPGVAANGKQAKDAADLSFWDTLP